MGDSELKSAFLFRMVLDLAEPLVVGDTGHGRRQVLHNTCGWFEGPRMRGKVLPHGADWLMHRPDGVSEVDVRVLLHTDDDALIYMRSSGLFHYPRESARRVLSGEASPDEYYLRDVSFFETGAEQYAWLNRVIAVGVGAYRTNAVEVAFYEVR
jgi:hypothetical protein